MPRAWTACTFPSTTPTSLTSLGTGVPPGQHGILGFTVNVPGTERVLNHIFWRDDPAPADWQPVPTWFERLRDAGVPCHLEVVPGAFHAFDRLAARRPVARSFFGSQCASLTKAFA